MGTTYKRGDRWGISYIDPQGRQIRKMVADYKESAEKILRKIETEITEGKYLDIKKYDAVLFEAFASDYIQNHVLFLKGAREQKYTINRLCAEFKGLTLDKVDAFKIKKYIARRTEVDKVKPATINRALSTLRSMYNRAIEWGKFNGTSPLASIKPLEMNNSRCRWLTEDEAKRLIASCEGLTRVVVIVALQTGMRWGEITSLKRTPAPCCNYVDFENQLIYLHKTKTKSRHIPLSKFASMALKSVEPIPGTDHIFYNPQTKKPYGSFKRSYNNALKKAGIEDLRFHDLRHDFASQLVLSGVDLYTVQRLLGHTTPQMTQRYAHLSDGHLKKAIEKIDTQRDDLLYNLISIDTLDSTNLAHCSLDKH